MTRSSSKPASRKHQLRNATKHKELSALKFKWLKQFVRDVELTLLAYRVAGWMIDYFSADHDGAAQFYQEVVAKALKTNRTHVNRAIQLLVERGHLAVVRQGRNRPNLYRMALYDVSQEIHHEGDDEGDDVSSEVRACTIRDTLKTLNQEPGSPNGAPHDDGGGCNDPPPRNKARKRAPSGKPKTAPPASVPATLADSPLSRLLSDLLAIWERGHFEDTDGARLSLSQALQTTTPANIIHGARLWVAAYDGRMRYLPSLVKWLDNHGWTKQPPTKSANGRSDRLFDPGAQAFVDQAYEDEDDDNTFSNRVH